jgi:hypothetical protein
MAQSYETEWWVRATKKGKVNTVYETASQPAKFRYRVKVSDKLSLCKLRAYERVRYQIAGIRELICVCDG